MGTALYALLQPLKSPPRRGRGRGYRWICFTETGGPLAYRALQGIMSVLLTRAVDVRESSTIDSPARRSSLRGGVGLSPSGGSSYPRPKRRSPHIHCLRAAATCQ